MKVPESLKCFEEDLLYGNDYHIGEKIADLQVIMYVMNNPDDTTIQSILAWKGERDTRQCGTYFDLCESVFNTATNDHDCFSSSGTHAHMATASEVVQFLGRQRIEKLSKEKKDRIKELEKEKQRLDAELKEIMDGKDG